MRGALLDVRKLPYEISTPFAPSITTDRYINVISNCAMRSRWIFRVTSLCYHLVFLFTSEDPIVRQRTCLRGPKNSVIGNFENKTCSLLVRVSFICTLWWLFAPYYLTGNTNCIWKIIAFKFRFSTEPRFLLSNLPLLEYIILFRFVLSPSFTRSFAYITFNKSMQSLHSPSHVISFPIPVILCFPCCWFLSTLCLSPILTISVMGYFSNSGSLNIKKAFSCWFA